MAGVDYVIGGKVLPAGTYPGSGTVTVTAQAQPGYVLAPGALKTWTAALRGSLIAAVPKITGTAKVGYTLTVNAGTWGPAPVILSYQWYLARVIILGATAPTDNPAVADITKTLTVQVTGTNAGYVSSTQTSAATTAVERGSLAGPVPRITGTAKVGYTLTASPGTWGPAPVTLRYQWYRSGVAITGATAPAYRPTAADVTKGLSVRVTGTKTGYSTAAKTSAASPAVAKGTRGAPAPRITGNASVGYTLTAITGAWTPAAVTLRYQWYRSGVAIPGATRAAYRPGLADLRKTLTVRVTGTKAGYTSVTKASAGTRSVVR